MYFPFSIPKSGRKRSAHSRRRFIQRFLKAKQAGPARTALPVFSAYRKKCGEAKKNLLYYDIEAKYLPRKERRIMDFTGFLGNDAIKRRLSGAFASGRVAHSYLLCGPAGSGKHTLARILCAAMECEKDGAAVPCGVCPGCRKALAGIHPDVITVDDPDHKAMTVDPIRAARSDMFIRPNEGRRKIYVIPRGQDMNESAQNALLKILEEPPDYGAFLILSTNAERLLPTIRSRCAELQLGPVDEQTALPMPRATGWICCACFCRWKNTNASSFCRFCSSCAPASAARWRSAAALTPRTRAPRSSSPAAPARSSYRRPTVCRRPSTIWRPTRPPAR